MGAILTKFWVVYITGQRFENLWKCTRVIREEEGLKSRSHVRVYFLLDTLQLSGRIRVLTICTWLSFPQVNISDQSYGKLFQSRKNFEITGGWPASQAHHIIRIVYFWLNWTSWLVRQRAVRLNRSLVEFILGSVIIKKWFLPMGGKGTAHWLSVLYIGWGVGEVWSRGW